MSDVDRLQGAWHLSGADVDGRSVDEEMMVGASIVISGHTFKSIGMGAPYEGTLSLNEKAKPRAIDMKITTGHAAGRTHPGIYKLAGDRFILCINVASAERPTKFASAAGVVLETFERSRGTGSRRSATAAATRKSSRASKQQTGSTEATPLEGEWAMVAGVFNGATMAPDMVRWCKRVTRGDVTTVLAGPRTMIKARFTLDQSMIPTGIDYVILEGPDKGKPALGVVEWSADTLSINMSDPGKPRPKDFHCRKGDKRSFTAWRLLKR